MFSFREIILSIRSYGKAHRFIREHKLWGWIVIPGLVYCLLFAVGLYLIWAFSGGFTTGLFNRIGVKAWILRLQSGWVSFLFLLLGLALRLVLLLFYISVFKYFILITGSPLFAFLSGKTAAIVDKEAYSFNFPRLLKETGRGIRLSLKNLLYQTFYFVVLFILSFIPLIGWVTPLVAFLVECYFFGFSMLDYSNQRQRLSPKESIIFIREHRGLAIGNGLIFYLLNSVPVLGWIPAPSYAVIAATLQLKTDANERQTVPGPLSA